MELPHQGVAFGADLEWSNRLHWDDSTYGNYIFKKSKTEQYTKLTGYAMAALPVPLLSEKTVLLPVCMAVFLLKTTWTAIQASE